MKKSEITCGIKSSGRRTSGSAAKKVAILPTASHRRRQSRTAEAPVGESIDGFSRLWTIKAKDVDRLRSLALQLTPDAVCDRLWVTLTERHN